MALLAQAFVRVRPDASGFGALLKTELEKQLAGMGPIGERLGSEFAMGLRSGLSEIKQDLANIGVADLLDINIPRGKLVTQLMLIKRLLQQVGVSDLLDINVKQSDLIAAIRKISDESVPLKIAVDTEALADITLPHLPSIDEAIHVSGVQAAAAAYEALGGDAQQLAAGLAAASDQTQALTKWLTTGETAVATSSAEFETAVTALADLRSELEAVGAAAGGAAGGGGGRTGLAGFAGAAGGARGATTLFGGALGGTIGGIALWHLALEATIETLISVVSASAAAAVGIMAMEPAAEAVGTQLQNVHTIGDALGVTLPPMTDQFAKLQQAMTPRVIEAYGGALAVVSRTTGTLTSVGSQVVTMFDDWVAQIDIWMRSQGGVNSLLQGGVVFLGQFARIIGTVASAVGNLLTKDPGIAHFLLDILQAGASALSFFSKLPTALVETALALHGAYVWGSVLGGVFARLGNYTGLTKLGVALGILRTQTVLAADGTKKLETTLLGLNAAKWGSLALLGAALGFVVYQSDQAQGSVAKFITQLETKLTALPAGQEITQIGTDITELQRKAGSFTLASAEQQMSDFQKVVYGVHGVWSSFVNLFTAQSFSAVGHALSSIFTIGGNQAQAARQAVSSDIRDINGAIASMFKGQTNLDTALYNTMDVQTKLSGTLHGQRVLYGAVTTQAYSFADALQIMNLAGVKWTDSLPVMLQKIANLIAGYKTMSISGTIFTNTLQAMNFASFQQQSNISKVTSAWSAFFTTVSGGASGFVSFAQAMDTLNTSLKVAKTSLDGLNPSSLTAQQNFLSAAQAAQTEMNNLLNLAAAAGMGASGAGALGQATKDMLAELLPAARQSQTMTTILYALAQQGGYQGADSFRALAKWVGNVKNPMLGLQGIVSTFTVKAGNLATDVNNLSTALGAQLNQAMAAAVFTATGGQTILTNFADAVLKTGTASDATQKAANAMAQQFLVTTGSVKTAHDEFITFAEHALGLTRQTADQLWKDTLPSLQNEIDKLHGKNVDISVGALGGYNAIRVSQPTLADIIAHVSRLAGGGLITAGTGPTADDVLIRASKGETVLSASQSKALAPVLGAAGVRGYAQGGLLGLAGYGQQSINASTAGAQNLAVAGMAAAMVAGLSAATAAGRASLFSGGAYSLGNLMTVAYYLVSHGATVAAAAGIAGTIAGESGGSPEAVGSGGAGLIGWTPPSSAFPIRPIVTGNAARDMQVQLVDMMAYIAANGGLGPLNALTNPMSAAWLFSGRYERPAVTGSDIRPSAVNAVYAALGGGVAHGHGHRSFDHGGWLMPGHTMSWNGTGRPEVVSPESKFDELIHAVDTNTAVVAKSLAQLMYVTASAPGATGTSLANALNGVARSAGYQAIYSNRP